MVYRIADYNIQINSVYQYVQKECAAYVCDKAQHIDFVVTSTAEDIEKENALAEKNGRHIFSPKLEPYAIYRKICAEILKRDGFLMHGAVIEYKGRGYLFTAQSGTGKTTHILQWKKMFGDENVVIVNGDKPIIRFVDGKVYAYGTPWNGKERFGTTGKVELNAVCFIERGEANFIERINSADAVPRLFSQIMITDSSNLAKQLEFADILVENVPMYLLKCNVSEEAAKVAYEGMC